MELALRNRVRSWIPSKLWQKLETPSALAAGTEWSNRLGHQVARMLFWNLWRLHPKPVAKAHKRNLELLHRDGILMIPNYLPKSIFDEIRSDYDALKKKGSERVLCDHTSPYYSHNTEFFTSYHSKVARRFFAQDEELNALITALSHRKIHFDPEMCFWGVKRELEDYSAEAQFREGDFHGLHCDTVYPSYKIFFYLNDIPEENAPLTYVLGSHRLTPKRLLLAYKMSVRAHKRKNEAPEELRALREKRWIPHPEDIEQLGLKEKPMIAPKNTLVLFNVQGFHRRSELKQKGAERDLFHIDFRAMECWRNFLTRKSQKTHPNPRGTKTK